jgi:hypothetical protein
VIRCDDVDALHAEFVGKNVAIHIAPVEQTWARANSAPAIPIATVFCFQLLPEASKV